MLFSSARQAAMDCYAFFFFRVTTSIRVVLMYHIRMEVH